MTNCKTKRTLYVGALLVLALSTLLAQNAGKISGVVLDDQTGEPLIGSNVVVLGTSLGSSTDLDGSFFILNVPVGKYEVQATMIGYAKVTKTDVIVNLNKTTTVDFKLTPSVVLQKDVIIEAVRPDVEKEKTSTSMITRFDEVSQLPAMHSVSDVLNLSSEVKDGHFRGGRSGGADNDVLYTLQGLGTINPLDNSSAINPIMSAVEEVEVVTSGFGAQYGNAQSGVVNISMKEGKSDKWHSFAEFRMNLPQQKHFGPSPWDVSNNPYLQELLNERNWNLTVTDGVLTPHYGSSRQGVPNGTMILGNDSVELAQVAFALYKQLNNHVNRSYGNKPDYSGEFSTGGPLSESMRMFVAFNTSVSWPVLATEHPDENSQIMGNIVTDVGGSSSLRLSGAYSQKFDNTIPTNDNSYFSWLYNMINGLQYRERTNVQLGLRFAKTLDSKTFYEVKLNTLSTRTNIGSRNSCPDSLIGALNGNVFWVAKQIAAANAYQANPATTFQDNKTQTVSLDFSITSQVTKAHLMNAGIQANMYFIDVKQKRGGSFIQGWTDTTDFYVKPIEGSIYVQDKMEFEGMIANVGLRLDAWQMRSNYDPVVDSTYAPSVKAPILGRLQPRVGFSFPVSLNTVFHVNYGSYIQRPSFQYLTYERKNGNVLTNVPNPRLKPQTTNSYDVGIAQALGEGFTADLSGYYKNITDLVRQMQLTGFGQNYTTYINYDFADVRGFHLSLVKRSGTFNGSVNYSYNVSTGSSASATRTNFTKKYLNNGGVISIETNESSLPSQAINLDYDRTHNLVVNVGYVTDEKFGFQVGNAYPLGDIALAVNSTAISGRPYTFSNKGEYMNMQTPAEYNTNLKVSKRFKNFHGTTLTCYVEVFNVFNSRIYNYDYIFASSLAANNDDIIKLYLNGNFTSRDGLLYYSQVQNYASGLGVDQSFIIYSNQPRSYWFGLSVEF
jgi:outer membrane receptor protein involved in Fe transport